jgi:hypothetical protein
MIHPISSLTVVGSSIMFRLSDSRLDVLHRRADMSDLSGCWQHGFVSFQWGNFARTTAVSNLIYLDLAISAGVATNWRHLAGCSERAAQRPRDAAEVSTALRIVLRARRHQGSITNDLFREKAHDPLRADRRNSEENK